MNFKDFKKDVESAFNAMIADNLFVVNVDKDLLWMSYLLSFEDETIRQDHNCNACKSFIRHYGKVVCWLRNSLRKWKVCPKMKSDNDLQNSDNCVVLKTVSPQILDKLRESGLTVCTCCEFPGTAWLVFRPNMPTSDIHGEGYDFEEIGLFGTEAVLKYFEANTPNYVDCGTDVDKFINICLQFK